MSRFELSRSAELDLDEIDLQTIELFGFDQADKTEAAFIEAFRTLAEMPHLGHHRDDLNPPGRVFRYWTVLHRFLIVYQPTEEGIHVARIVDASRNLRCLLETNPGDPSAPTSK